MDDGSRKLMIGMLLGRGVGIALAVALDNIATGVISLAWGGVSFLTARRGHHLQDDEPSALP